MQKVERSEEVSLDFSGMTLTSLEDARSTLEDNIKKIGKENIQTINILNCALSEINSEIKHKLLFQKLYSHKHLPQQISVKNMESA